MQQVKWIQWMRENFLGLMEKLATTTSHWPYALRARNPGARAFRPNRGSSRSGLLVVIIDGSWRRRQLFLARCRRRLCSWSTFASARTPFWRLEHEALSRRALARCWPPSTGANKCCPERSSRCN
jgi:hypothetical protein